MMNRRILHIVHQLRHSGAEMLVRDLCLRHLANGLSCAISSYTPTAEEFQRDEARLRRKGVQLYISQNALVKSDRARFLSRIIRNFRPDLIYGHSVIPALYGRLALPLRSGAKFVSVLHSNDDYRPNTWRYPELLLTWRTSRIFAVSELGAQNYRARIPYGAQVYHLPNGIDVTRFSSQSRERSRSALGLSDKDRLILQVGRIYQLKQQHVTIRALIPLLIARPTLQIWLAGLSQDQGYEGMLRDEINASSVKDRIKLLGSRNDIPDLLSAADVYVMPSEDESQGIALLEALASSLPVVASNIEAFRPFAQWPGVRLVEPNSEADYRSAVASLLDGPRYPGRDMRKFDITRTVSAYEAGLPID